MRGLPQLGQTAIMPQGRIVPGGQAATTGMGMPTGTQAPAIPQGMMTNTQAPQTGLIGSETALTGGLQAALDALYGGAGQARQDFINYGNQAVQRAGGPGQALTQQGLDAANMMAAFTGAQGPEAQAQAYANFAESPGQQFLRDRMEQSLLRNASATGGLGGGAVRSALQEQAMGLAQQDFGNYFNRLSGVADQGLGRGFERDSLASQLLAQQGAGLGELAYGTGTRGADLFTGAARDISGGRTMAGRDLANAIQSTQSALANLQQQQGQGLAGLYGGAQDMLANLMQSGGAGMNQDFTNLMTLLANLSSQQGTQLGQAALSRGGTQSGDSTPGILGALAGFF